LNPDAPRSPASEEQATARSPEERAMNSRRDERPNKVRKSTAAAQVPRLDRTNTRALVAHVDREFYRKVKTLAAKTDIPIGLLLYIILARGVDDFNDAAPTEVYEKLLAALVIASKKAKFQASGGRAFLDHVVEAEGSADCAPSDI
jgi:hypothetical protein